MRIFIYIYIYIFLRSWLSYVVEKYQPGTVRSYLMSLRLFYKFLSQEEVPLPNVTKDLLNARCDLMMSWSSAQKKKVLKQKLEKHDEDYRKLLSSENLHKVCHGSLHVNAVKQLAATSTETNCGNITEEIISDKSHCEVRDWLMTCILIDNSGRSGVVANMTTGEFKEAVFYNGTDDDPARYREDVKDHKTAGVYGAAVVWIYDNLYVLIDMYIRTFRSQLIPTDSEVQEVFISSNGLSLTSSQVSYSVFRTFQREGVQVKGRICATTIRKVSRHEHAYTHARSEGSFDCTCPTQTTNTGQLLSSSRQSQPNGLGETGSKKPRLSEDQARSPRRKAKCVHTCLVA